MKHHKSFSLAFQKIGNGELVDRCTVFQSLGRQMILSYAHSITRRVICQAYVVVGIILIKGWMGIKLVFEPFDLRTQSPYITQFSDI